MTLQPQKLNEILLFSTVCKTIMVTISNGVPMATKLVLEILALCNKDEISYVK